ncbi:MAG: GntR family transcriptional regulator [Candidatus Dormibacteria bacterium]
MESTYRRVAAQLREEIDAGRWKAGDTLPPTQELQERFNVSRPVVRASIAELVRENLVYTATRRGTVVLDVRVADHALTNQPLDSAETAVAHLQGEWSMSFAVHMEPAAARIAGWLGIGADDFVVVRSLTRFLDSQPWSREVSYYPQDVARATGLDSPHSIEDISGKLQDGGYREVAWRDEVIARPATSEEATALHVAVGTYISDVTRIRATTTTITRVTRTVCIASRNRFIHEGGEHKGINVIHKALAHDE